ncbi:lysoplasmalogenase [Oceanobacillus arenosus]|uniref:Lysoplasmalogenase n=1 Tax=Oceanobacillus arenosus TaxID=1229153 RepID=A0A3D8Q3M9_9BACI|nr:lysoplasmalogenase [Oceanobacillus arenosus]RDW22468.1 lysoplasmalogenase [Oceanobacillus arenosus]
MIIYRFPILILMMVLVYLYIVPAEPFIFKLFFKLIPIVMIIIYAFRQLPWKKTPTHSLILIGLSFCIIGDATLHWFLIGLSAFLIGHLFYMIGFLLKWKFSKVRFMMLIPIAVYGLFFGNDLVKFLHFNGDAALIFPILCYLIVISFMAWSAIMTGNKWAILGSILFVISDSILAWHLFISPVKLSEPLIMLNYYGGQFLIANSLGTIVAKNRLIVW